MNKTKKLNLNKYAFLNYLKGDVFSWLENQENFNKYAENDKFLLSLTPWRYKDNKESNKNLPYKIIEGIKVGEFAKNWAKSRYPNHKTININKNTNLENVEYTNYFLNLPEDYILFEATFKYKDFFIKTDILIKTGNSIKIVEVKAVTKAKEIHAWDLYFQRKIISNSNPKNKWLYTLLILNEEYREKEYSNDIEKSKRLFKEVDNYWKNSKEQMTFNEFYFDLKVNHKVGDFNKVLNDIKEIQLLNSPPIKKLDIDMWSYLDTDYMPWVLKLSKVPEDSIFDLKSRSYKILKKINGFNSGIKTIKDSPLSLICPKKEAIPSIDDQNTKKYINLFLNSPPGLYKFREIIQKHFIDKNDELIHKEGLKKELKKYNKTPIYMYDFEAADLAIPKVKGSKPYQHIPYQFSIHIITNPDCFNYETMKNVIHIEWIAKDKKNFYQEFWDSFLNVILKYGEGIYVSWNKKYEKRLIKEISNFDWISFSKEQQLILKKIYNETIDLMDPFEKRFYYHKDFKGSASIKYVGNHFAKNLDYSKLNNVHIGTESSAIAKKWLSGDDDQEWLNLKKDMLKYCEYDTLLMVAILQKLKEKI